MQPRLNNPLFYFGIAQKPFTRSGFTLIELLTVITIIAVLSAIVVPVVSKIQDKARNSQCVANLGSLQKGIILFAGENDGRLPFEKVNGESKAVTGYEPYNWHRRISPYVGGPSAIDWKDKKPVPAFYLCPSDQAPYVSVMSYGMNWNLLDTRLAAITNNPIVLADSTTPEVRTPTTSSFGYITTDHHAGSVNCSKIDGSVVTFKGLPPTLGERPDLWTPNQKL